VFTSTRWARSARIARAVQSLGRIRQRRRQPRRAHARRGEEEEQSVSARCSLKAETTELQGQQFIDLALAVGEGVHADAGALRAVSGEDWRAASGSAYLM
jgi:hypothetical protein